MTDYIDSRLPHRVEAGFRGGPEWMTRITTLRNGREVRNRMRAYPTFRYTASIGAFTAADRQALIDVFMATFGKHLCFRFRDPTDYRVTAEPLSPEIGTSTPVQLSRAYAFGPSTAVGLIQAPSSGTVVVYRNGSPVTVSVDHLTGLVTPSAPWAAGTYTFACQYDRWVRFDSDWGAFTAEASNVYTAELELVEVRR